MFGGRTNDGYYELGLATARIIRESIMLGMSVCEEAAPEATEVLGGAALSGENGQNPVNG